MKSEWKPTFKQEGMSILHGVYRLLDKKASDHPGNREYSPNWYHKAEIAERAASQLNKESGDLENDIQRANHNSIDRS